MKKILMIVVVPLILGAVGYGVGMLLAPAPVTSSRASPDSAGPVRETLYKLPLGKFTIQVMQPGSVVHIRIDMDVYVAGAGAFEKINGAEGRAYLRDATIAAISDLAESTLWADEGREKGIAKEELARQIVLKIHRNFPMIRSARVNAFDTSRSARL